MWDTLKQGKCTLVVVINSAWGGHLWAGLWRMNRSLPDRILTNVSKFLTFIDYLKLPIDILLG